MISEERLKTELETVIQLFETLMRTKDYKYICPLCIMPSQRYDKFYEHIRETNEVAHRDLAAKWFRPSCPLCNTDTTNMFLRHMYDHHNQEYQTLMKETLHLRSDAKFRIPSAPSCCEPQNFLRYREGTGIIELPPRKRKRDKMASEPVAEIKPDRLHPSMLPVNSTLHETPGNANLSSYQNSSLPGPATRGNTRPMSVARDGLEATSSIGMPSDMDFSNYLWLNYQQVDRTRRLMDVTRLLGTSQSQVAEMNFSEGWLNLQEAQINQNERSPSSYHYPYPQERGPWEDQTQL